MAGVAASGERSAHLARANPVVASMAGASVTVPRQEPAAPSSGALLRRSATARAAKRRQLHQPNLGSEGRPTPRWQPLHASYAAGAADARSRAPRTLFLAAAAANCRIRQCPAQLQNQAIHSLYSSLCKKQTTQGSRSVGAFRAPPLPPAPVWHLLGPFKTLGFKGSGCGRPPWPQALRKRYLRVQIRSTRLRSQISESEIRGANQCMQNR